METRVIIADDHSIFLEGLKALLEKKGVMVVATATNGREARDLAIRLRPDVVIMDISMPDLNGVDATAIIRRRIPKTKVIALSMHSSRQSIDKMFASGASGYVLKESAFDELYEAIREVKNDGFYLPSSIAGLYAGKQEKLLKDIAKRLKFKKISMKEREVIQRVAEGKRNRTIAAELGLSVKTVETHRRNIMKKLGVSSVAELTKFAIKEGIISLE